MVYGMVPYLCGMQLYAVWKSQISTSAFSVPHLPSASNTPQEQKIRPVDIIYESETTLNHVMSDIFDHSYDINIQSLAPSQDCTTLWDYLKGLSPALQVLSFVGRQLQLHCHNKPKMTKWFKVDPVEIGMFSTE